MERLLLILFSVLAGLLLFMIPIGLMICYQKRKRISTRRNPHLQLNEEQFRQNIEQYIHHNQDNMEIEKKAPYNNFHEEDIVEGVPRR